MPGSSRVPVSVRRCVRAVAAEDGDLDRAFAICVAQGQKNGELKTGTIQPTAKGAKRGKAKAADKDASAKDQEYEMLLKGARKESLSALVARGWALIEQEEEPDLSKKVSGALKVTADMEVGPAPTDVEPVLKLLRQYRQNLQGDVGGTNGWTVERMKVSYAEKDSVIRFVLWLILTDYKGTAALTDVAAQLTAAALELSHSMFPKGAREMLGKVTPDKVITEIDDFVPAE